MHEYSYRYGTMIAVQVFRLLVSMTVLHFFASTLSLVRFSLATSYERQIGNSNVLIH